MNRKEADRTKRPKTHPGTYVGNNRQMLQDIRDSLSHVRKPPNVEVSKVESMQLKVESGSSSSNSDPRTGGGIFKSSAYRQNALAEIRNSLLPFANAINCSASPMSTLSSSTTSGVSSASGLSTASGSSSPCPTAQHQNGIEKDVGGHSQRFIIQQLVPHGYDEEMIVKAIKIAPVRSVEVVAEILMRASNDGPMCLLPKAVRRQSFEPDFSNAVALLRGSPSTIDSSTTASNRSDSPSCAPIQIRSGFVDPPRLISQPGDGAGYIPVSRQYSPNFGLEPPPPPPPRPQAPSCSTRGTTPPPSPSQPPFLPSSQVPHLLKRISPVPQSTRPQVVSYCTNLSQSSNTQRGTSPSSLGRLPVVVQNSQQIQQQLNQQLQNLALYNGSSVAISTGQVEPPPPYPIGIPVGKITPPLGFSISPQSRQSPTQPSALDYNPVQSQKRAGVATFQSSPLSLPNTGISTSVAVGVSVASRPVPLQAWSTRQPPIIMQSVKSTQVQKPVLQTAIAPTAPPPPCYPSSVQQQKTAADIHAVHRSSLGNVESPGPSHSNLLASSPTAASAASPVQTIVPTTDPPSYASSIQALAAQHGLAMPTAAASVASTATTNVCNSILSSYNLQLHSGASLQPGDNFPGKSSVLQVSSDSGNTSCGNSHAVNYIHDTQLQKRSVHVVPHPTSQNKFSSAKCDPCISFCSDSSNSIDVGNQLAMSFTSGLSSDPSLQEGQSRAPPPPLPPAHKTTLHSPIPERKSKDRDDEGAETKVKNYSPQAYKFYMEQHMENVFKSRQQRIHRRVQLETEMAKVGLSEEAQCQMRRMLHQKESNYIRLRRAKMEKSMFVKIRTIGVGAFGEVALVRKIDTNHLYAMKTLRKVDVLKRNQVAHVKAERDILAEADNEWVVKLYYSFQDKDNLYFVMDYIPGGDLMSLLIKFGTFDEPLARFYIAELLCAIESVHKMGFIHRDIKPDNILIDRDGHIKLTDFGLCTGFRWTHNSKYYQRNGEHGRQDSMDPDESCWTNECRCHDASTTNSSSAPLKPLERRRLRREHQRCLAHSLVGTPNYIAPEVLMRTGYTQLCDWWSVGVIMYEMLVGQPPFLANTPAETQLKVIHWETTLRIPKHDNFSAEAKDLIMKLCTSHDKRIGKNGASEVKVHPFFNGVDFEGGLRRQRAPYLPTICFATDTSNFDPVDPDKLRNSDGSDESRSEMGVDGGKHPEHAFFEFTFRRFFDDGGHAYPTKLGLDDNDGQGPVYV